ncbi:hypothetical protein [Shimia thalassica]|nr:hypothetical protein [Shimia thalassica]MDO6799351.1 hypothetical protein [Shimia thalassica]
MHRKRTFRREKETPSADMWHTLRVGLAIGVILLIVLPLLAGH